MYIYHKYLLWMAICSSLFLMYSLLLLTRHYTSAVDHYFEYGFILDKPIDYSTVFYLGIYIALLALPTNQKRFHLHASHARMGFLQIFL